MDKRFVQAHKEARWALWLTLLYLAAGWPPPICGGGYWLYRPATLV